MVQSKVCKKSGCTSPVKAREMCNTHYRAWQRRVRGHRGSGILPPLEDGTVILRGADVLVRFWAKVDKNGPVPARKPELGPCWIWRNGTAKGYGRFYVDGKKVLAHRFCYELLARPIPSGLELDHLCSVRRCVNPAHLEPVTHRVNQHRGTPFIAAQTAQTHCVRNHEFTPENTRIYRGKRVCLACIPERRHKRKTAA